MSTASALDPQHVSLRIRFWRMIGLWILVAYAKCLSKDDTDMMKLWAPLAAEHVRRAEQELV